MTRACYCLSIFVLENMMSHLFENDDTFQQSAAMDAKLVSELTDGYFDLIILRPPTPSFNTRLNGDRALAAAGYASKRDVARFLAVLDDLGLTIVKKSKGEKL